MGDLISRSKLIEEVKSTVDMQDTYLPIVFIDIARNMPTVKAQPRWISCSERLPETTGNYLCTMKVLKVDVESEYSVYRMIGHFNQGEKPFWTDDSKSHKTIAWMPLPEPYNAE